MTDKELKAHNIYLNIAEEIAKFSKCTYFQVGSIIVFEGRIISTGYNGTPPGFPEECNHFFNGNPKEREEHHKFAIYNTTHSEVNCILTSARNGISIKNADMYVTLQPCHECLKVIAVSGIRNIYYRRKYDKADPYSFEYCKKAKINLIHIK